MTDNAFKGGINEIDLAALFSQLGIAADNPGAFAGEWSGGGDRIDCHSPIDGRKLGSVTLEPGTRLRVRRIAEHRHALALDEGELHARILAPARVFQVDTPAGEAVDLGCAYRLRVAPDGSSELSVLEGRVAFEYDGRSVFVPAGASCASVPGRGPDAPRFRDAPRKLVALLERLEFEPDPEPAAVRALVELVERREDALTLFHLLDARSPLLRKAALDRIAQLTRLPEGTTPEGLLGGDAGMRLQLREVLEPWWRTESGYWER